MGFFTLSVAGGGFLLIGAWEALSSLNSIANSNPDASSSSLNTVQTPSQSPHSTAKTAPSSSSLSFIFAFLLSFLVILNSLVSFFDAVNSSDRVGSTLQLPVLAIASLFLLYSILGLLVNLKASLHLPSTILSLIALFAFVEEFLLFYLQRKDTSGIENRYFDLLLVPITICVISTMFELKSPKLSSPKIVRGVGLILQGTWFLQMGLSFCTNLITDGCSLHEKSRGNYTIKCKGHPEYHRARAIATLQFNCHLALLVVLVIGVYSIIIHRNGGAGDFLHYRPIGAEMQPFGFQGQFTLDSDDDLGEESNLGKTKQAVINVNGHDAHQ
ncbi:hypothetical protein IC582_008840 [Cucumis melo]|uniref:Uncharacterized protein LOC103487052 n=2 Tax=Cucumis melo TaxID=3656 RepID=A0A1S3B7M7_CUCME|nr:uncharacterized protein LOC103487052 [Cucumis melo]KAA0053707.1 uncharacterized protein E6C27_scaffold135G00810 [Cucumis melo var. makuwa]TYK17751.1 uncharacterized protein E5676_scaffold1804G00240 [Cucumis melo var. makuwa]